ncbi:LacI family DNA-binding transcriptional regulator [Herbiconiux sp. P18]|uniref:LacI family DNA-binding transcriptional regulator n=1 Tax=Herbiconiux liangxiaofengii TaxID=3342795 RepID=UPI0035B945FE
MPRIRTARQSDIARLAGVSQATVSMVLNGRADSNRIPESTQQRIREAMVELDYVPNIAAQSLRGGRNNLIGVHTFERVFPVAPEDYYHEFLNGIEEQAVDAGLDLVLFASTQRPDGTRTIYGNGGNRLRIADGAVMLGFETNDEELRRLADEGYPFVFIGHREVPGVEIPFVTADYAAAMRPVVDLLAQAGHRNVVYLAAPLRGFAQRERLEGFERSAAGSPLEGFSTVVLDVPAVTGEWVASLRDDGVTAVVAETYELARALRSALDAAGVRVPAELSVISLDSDPAGDGTFSHVQVPRREMGRRAVSLLLDVIEGATDAGASAPVACRPPSSETVAASSPARSPVTSPQTA